MILHNLSAQELADHIHVHRVTISALKRGTYLPSTKVLLALVDYFNCSADYLLGLVEFYTENQTFNSPVKSFGAHFRNVLQATKTSQYALTQKYNISGNLIYQWLNDLATPSVANLIKLSKCLDVPVDVLLGRSK